MPDAPKYHKIYTEFGQPYQLVLPLNLQGLVPDDDSVRLFSKVEIEPLFKEEVDFDTFSKSDFRAVKVKECMAVPKSKKLLQFRLSRCHSSYSEA